MSAGRLMYVFLIIVLVLLSGPVQAQEAALSGTPPAEANADLTEAVTLDELVRTALAQNPSIQAVRQTAQAKRTRVLPEKTLPDPMISFQTMGNLIPLSLQKEDPSSGRTINLEQEIPFPGKLRLRGGVAEAEADIDAWNYELIRRQIIADLKRAYYDYCLIHKSIEIVEKNKDLFQSFAEVAEARYRAGLGIQQDVLKAQVEISMLRDRLAVFEQRRAIIEAMINRLTYRPIEAPLGKPEALRESSFHYSFEELVRLAQANSPMLKMQEREIARNDHAVQLAQKEYYPDFSVGLSYVDRDEMREMYGMMVSVKVPLYFWRKQRPELQAARLNLAGAQKQRDSVVSSLSYEIKDSHTIAVTSEKLMQLYETTLVPQARMALESAVASYQVGKVDFLTLIESTVTVLDYELKYYEALTEFQKALAQIEPVVGVELTK